MLKETKIINEFHQEIIYKLPQQKIGQLDKDLYQIRQNKKEPIYVSDRKVLGEYIDNIRANMGYLNKDLSFNVYQYTKEIAGIQCRIYQSLKKASPCIIMIHGGAFIGGSIDVVENPCKLLSQYIEGTVINVDYSLSPEKSYPCAILQCQSVCEYVYQHALEMNIDCHHIYIMGDSAGANLAMAVSKYCSFLKGIIAYYPVTDLSYKVYKEIWSENLYQFKDDQEARRCIHSLEGSEELMIKMYLQNQVDSKDENVSPIYRKDMLDMLMISAEFDYLRIQGEYMASLFDCIDVIRYGGVNHAFLDKLGDLLQAEDSLQEVAKWILRRT